MDTITTDDGCHLWATSTGDGPPLILCHGGPGLWDMFGDVAAMLSDRLRVIRWDQRGCGRSERRGPYALARTVADLDAVRQHFGLDRVAVLGHSWGAQLALRYALDHPDRVRQLVYVSGVGLGWDWHPHYKRNLDARCDPARLTHVGGRELAVRQWSADFADSSRARDYAERMATPWFEVNYECNAILRVEDRELWQESVLIPQCRALPVPTLIVDGAQDIRVGRWIPWHRRCLVPHVPCCPMSVTCLGWKIRTSFARFCWLSCAPRTDGQAAVAKAFSRMSRPSRIRSLPMDSGGRNRRTLP